jgi:hypothetical protein
MDQTVPSKALIPVPLPLSLCVWQKAANAQICKKKSLSAIPDAHEEALLTAFEKFLEEAELAQQSPTIQELVELDDPIALSTLISHHPETNVNNPDGEVFTPLQRAVQGEKKNAARWLLEHGASPTIRTTQCPQSPKEMAVEAAQSPHSASSVVFNWDTKEDQK